MGHKRLSTTLIYAQIHNETVAEDYFTAMEQAELRLVNQLPQEKDVEDLPSNGATSRLLTLVNGLQKDPLTANQQVLLFELQQGLAALLKGTNGTFNPLVVNEPWALDLPLVAQPSS